MENNRCYSSGNSLRANNFDWGKGQSSYVAYFQYDFSFQVRDPQRIYYMYASTIEEYRQWKKQFTLHGGTD